MSARTGTLVIGAGISGLAYAHARGDADVLLLEASERAGGLIRTERGGEQAEFRYECGPEALRFERDSELTHMLAELGLEAHTPPAGATKRFVCWNARLHEVPLAPPKLLTSPLLTLGGKLRLLREPWRDPKVGLDGSIAEFVRHRIGNEALERMIDPLVSGIHAGDPEALSLRACFPRMVEMIETYGSLIRALRATRGSPAPSVMKPSGGNGSIAAALVRALGSRLRLNAAVQSVAFDGSTWAARTRDEVIESPCLVLALPSSAAARLLGPVAPELARAIGTVHSESLASVALAYRREDVAHQLDGFGYLVASQNGFAHLGTLFSSSIDASACPSGFVLLRVMIGGARHPEVVEWDDERILSCIGREVGPLLGLRGKAHLVAIQRWRSALPRFDLQHPARVAAIERSLPPGLTLLGNYLRGIGVNHLVDVARRTARSHAAAEPASAVARSSR